MTVRRIVAAAAIVAAGLVGCSDDPAARTFGGDARRTAQSASVSASAAPSASPSVSATPRADASGTPSGLSSRAVAPAPSPTSTRTSSAPQPVRTFTSPAPVPPWNGSSSRIDAATRSRMRYSYRSGCPVGIDDLRILRVDHWSFSGARARGEMVVHADQAASVLRVIRAMWHARFPIRQMRLVDVYGGSDDRSMAADNTSAFNCRYVKGTTRWSEHSYGRAIDINPIENPYVYRSGEADPPAGQPYANRSRRAKGMIHPSDAVVDAFAAIGWRWGGYWSGAKDYQHFSRSGR